MGTLWKIAVRNTLRHRRRTIITAVVMTAGIGTFIAFDSVISGMDRMAIDNMSAYTLSSLEVRNPAYVDDIEANPLDKGISDPQAVLSAMRRDGLQATPRVRFVATVSNYDDQIPVLACAVEPVDDTTVFKLSRAVVAGTWLSTATQKQVVLGAQLARELKLGVGDSVLISAQTVEDVTNADEYQIVGLVNTPLPEVNAGGLFMPLSDARSLLDAPTLVTEVDAALPRASNLSSTLALGDRTAARLRAQLPGQRVDAMTYLARDYLSLRNAKAKYSFLLILVVLLIAAVGIVNTILMSVYSRVREIGVLRAYGMTPREIKRLFTLEGLAVGIVGSVFGLALGIVCDAVMIAKGFALSEIGDAFGSLPLGGTLYGEWNPRTMIFGFVFGLAISVIAARIPARRAAKLEPTAALRFQ